MKKNTTEGHLEVPKRSGEDMMIQQVSDTLSILVATRGNKVACDAAQRLLLVSVAILANADEALAIDCLQGLLDELQQIKHQISA